MVNVLAVVVSPPASVLSQIVVSVASALIVVILTFIANTLRRYARDHDWLMQQTKANSDAIGKNTDAIRQLLEERRPARRK